LQSASGNIFNPRVRRLAFLWVWAALAAGAEPGAVKLPAHTEAVPDRWRIPVGIWERYENPARRGTETP